MPVIGRVHGACAGFGLSLALGCDMVLACNEPRDVDALLDRWRPAAATHLAARAAAIAAADDILANLASFEAPEAAEVSAA